MGPLVQDNGFPFFENIFQLERVETTEYDSAKCLV